MSIFEKVMASGDYKLMMEYSQLTLDCIEEAQEQWFKERGLEYKRSVR